MPEKRGKLRRGRSRGFVHVLLLVFAILGISMWGISEMLQRSEEKQQAAEEAKITGLQEGRKALLNYALVAPPYLPIKQGGSGRYNQLILQDNNDFIHNDFHDSNAGGIGRPNILSRPPDLEGGGGLPYSFRYFALPCSDVHAKNSVRVGQDNATNRSCERFVPATGSGLGDLSSVVGLFPWQSASYSQYLLYAHWRGAGGRKILDGYGNLLWYAVSPNAHTGRIDRAFNPHWLLRQTDHWLNLYNAETGEVTKRVAAVVVAPGVFGAGNSGTRVVPLPSVPVGIVFSRETIQPQAYLEESVLAVTLNNTITIVAPTSSASDQLDYITVEQLAAIDGEGIERVGEGAEDIYRIPEGRARGAGEFHKFFGVKDLLQRHFERYGYLPSPAEFSRSNAILPTRPAGVRRYSGILAGRTGPSVLAPSPPPLTLTLLMPGSHVRRVYLQEGTRLQVVAATSGGSSNAVLPPFNLALYNMDTALNGQPLAEATRTDLINDGLYPQNNLFGFQHPDDAGEFPTAATDAARTRTYLLTTVLSEAALAAEALAAAALAGGGSARQQLPIGDFSVALAEPAFAYVLGNSLYSGIRYGGGAGEKLGASLPPQYGVQVQLPPGTRFLVSGTPPKPTLFLPKPVPLDEGAFNPSTQVLVLNRQWPVAVDLHAPEQMFTVTAVVAGTPVKAGNSGFLPVDGTPVTILAAGSTVSMGSQSTDDTLPGSDRKLLVPGGVRLPSQAMSNLPLPLRLHMTSGVTIIPFPPAGRPFVGAGGLAATVLLPSPLFTHEGVAGAVGGEFILPAGSRIHYPAVGSFVTGVRNFDFPAGTIARMQRGAVLTVWAEPDTTLPSGARLALGVKSGVTLVAGRRQITVTLFHGAMMPLDGAGVVLEQGIGLGTQQELFDIEMQTPYEVESAGVVSYSSLGGEVIQPFTGRSLRDIAPITLNTNIIAPLSRVRMRFLTRPRALVLSDVSVAGGAAATALAGLDEITVSVVAHVAATVGATTVTLALNISEQTTFSLPPRAFVGLGGVFAKTTLTSALEERVLVSSFVFPIGTGVYDPKIESLADININGIDGMAVLVSPLTVTLAQKIPGRGLVVHQLVMLPDADIAGDLGGAERLIPADSVVDVVQGVAWPPGAVRTLPTIAEDLRAVSNREIYMYFPQAVTLTNRGEFRWNFSDNFPASTVGILESSRVATVTVGYSQYPGLALTAAAHGRSTENEGVLTNGNIALPSGTFVIIAAGSTLDFLSYNRHTVGADANSVDYATLPENAIAVLPAGGTVTVRSRDIVVSVSITPPIEIGSVLSSYRVTSFPPVYEFRTRMVGNEIVTIRVQVGTSIHTFVREVLATTRIPGSTIMFTTPGAPVAITGPAHIRLGGSGGNGVALVNHSTMMNTSPVIYYEGDTYAFDGERISGMSPSSAQPDFSTRIPAGARGDIFGHITRRDGFNFATNMLPPDTREFLRNFPMVYAVAPRCRAEIADGEDCASDENGGGLEFALEEGEEILLEENLIAGGHMRIVPFSLLADGLQMSVRVFNMLDYANNQNEVRDTDGTLVVAPPLAIFAALSLAINQTSGGVMLYDSANPNTPFAYSGGEVIEVAVGANAPPDSVVRVYMNLSATVNLTAGNYADLPGVTVHAGGYTEGEYATAAALVTVDMGGFFAGHGARIIGIVEGEPLFGTDSGAPLAIGSKSATLRLDDYVPVGSGSYQVTLYPASDYTNVNSHGNISFRASAGSQLAVSETPGGGASAVGGIAAVFRPPPPLLTADITRTSIAMEPGYLWQGYLNPGGGQDVTLQFAANSALAAATKLVPEVYVRIQPVAEELTFWGTGRERPEGMDSRSISRQDETDRNNYITTGNKVVITNFLRRGTASDGVDVTLAGIRRSINRRAIIKARPFGWRSPIADGVIVNGVSVLMVRARVYDATSGNLLTTTALPWSTQQTRCEGGATFVANRYSVGNDCPTNSSVIDPGWFSWGYNASPYAVSDQSYIDNNEDVWALRRIVGNNVDVIVADNNGMEITVPESRRISEALIDDNARISLTFGGATGGANFNPPAFQMVATRVALPRGWSYQSKSANLPLPGEGFYLDATPRVGIAKCRDTQLTPPPGVDFTTPERVPGALLGAPADVERYQRGSGVAVCSGGDQRIFSFSSRVRRDSAHATYDFVNSDRQFLPQDTAATPPLGGVGITLEMDIVIPVTVELRGSTTSNPFSYTIPGDYKAGTLALSVTRQTPETTHTLTAPLSVTLASDLVFYMDTAYNTQTPGMVDAVPQQYLRFGDDFSISGPAALVPHFGGSNTLAVADVYGERSRLMSGLFGDKFALHTLYSAATYDCAADEATTPDNCPQMMNPDNARFWVPIVSGVVAYEAADVKVLGDRPPNLDAVVVLPQPQAQIVVAGSNGNTVTTILGGSIIHPYTGRVRQSVPITVRSRLVMSGDAVAAVDVSPVNLPTPIRFLRNRPALQSWDFNYAPVRMTVGSQAVIVQPLNFMNNEVIDFRTIRGEGATPGGSSGGAPTDTDAAGGSETAYQIINGGITATIRHDGTRTRGFLMNDRMADIMESYYSGEPVFVPEHGFTTYFPRRDISDTTEDITVDGDAVAWPRRLPVLRTDLLPLGNQVAPVGNPLSWHWLNRRAEGSFIPLGAARQFSIFRDIGVGATQAEGAQISGPPGTPAYSGTPSAGVHAIDAIGSFRNFRNWTDVYDSVRCGSEPFGPTSAALDASFDLINGHRSVKVEDVRPVRYPDFPFVGFPNLLTADVIIEFTTANLTSPDRTYALVPCAGSRAYYWTGVRAASSSTVYFADDDEFIALRLLHQIQIPQSSDIILQPHAQQSVYPSNKGRFFQFPAGSVANVLQADAASWESVHPYVSRHLPGAVIANDGGLSGSNVAEHMLVRADNDGHRQIDITDSRLLHYARTESAPGDHANSNAPVYTNMWIRLLDGGYLEPVDEMGNAVTDGERLGLLPGTVINPILGVYLPAPLNLPAEPLESNYAAIGQLAVPLTVVRPALIIPKGTTVRVGSGGGKITNVKAAAIFSLTPLQGGVSCPYGGIDAAGVAIQDGLAFTVTINQSREGVSETAYKDAISTLAGVTTDPATGGTIPASAAPPAFTLGHPCAWVDDRENSDGDRFFIYRSRRRYAEQHKVRVISNDRTYLLGGKLLLGQVREV